MPSALAQKTAVESFVAIDLGTRVGRIAAARGDGIRRAADAAGETDIPAVVALSPQGGMLAGTDARQGQSLFPAETVLAPKSLLIADAEELRRRGHFFPHPLDTGHPGLVRLEIGGRPRSGIEIVGLYLSALRRAAEASFERPVASAVITVPVDFSPFDRQALRLAARVGGFERTRFVDEPVAAALAWAARGFRGRAAVCCWGAGHFGAAIIEVQPELLRVVASVGSAAIGGDRLDLALAQDFLARAEQAHPDAGSLVKHRAHLARHFLVGAQQVKHDLVSKGRADLRLPVPGRGEAFRHTYARADLEGWLAPQLATAGTLCRAMFGAAGLMRGDVDALVLAGGMMRIPAVVEALAEVVGRSPADLDESGEAALRGALRRARFLDHDGAEPLVLDTLPQALGLESQGGRVNELLARTELLPAGRTELFTTYLEKQSEVGIQLYNHCGLRWEPLARVEVSRIPGMKESEPQIEVGFQLDEDGVLEVTAQETARNKPLGLEVRPQRGLTGAQWGSAWQEIPPPEERPFEEALREELRARGRLQMEMVRALARQGPGGLARDEKQLVTTKVKELEEVLEGGDLVEMRSCQRELGEALYPILQRVYDKSLEALLRQ
ncbi:MAG: Hsp70 family protein [Candidatus Eisenbacteria bacterium]|uniref:Hsp70 family protein n=1 Tax=Eiseniibacteriota bacterium TaxID=2212470 RepID=A0A938BKQ4_UNCEI|nr:Hsp70 family protein [Candidatus Eisenbacteria bacterium]